MVRQRTKRNSQVDAASPAKSTRSQVRARAIEPKKRAPQRCRKCPDAPLRAECTHSATGRRIALEIEASNAALPEATSPIVHPQEARQDSPNPFIYNTPIRQPAGFSGVVTPRTSETSIAAATPAGRTSPIDDFSEIGGSPILHVTSSPVIDPSLLALSGHTEQATPSTSTQSSQSPSLRPTLGNPFHDFVKGVYRGHEPHTIVRKKAKPAQIEQTSKSSKVFTENINALVEKCEDVSLKTGAWVFFGAQHPGARGAAINYASPRLRRDGRDDTNELATNFMSLINTVMAGKRADTMELQKKLEAERQENALMRAQLDKALFLAAENANALQEVRTMLADYQPRD